MSGPASAHGAEVRLPAYQRVSRYDVALVPDLAAFTFQGQVAITLELTEATRTVVLHSADCTFPKDTTAERHERPRVTITPKGKEAAHAIRCESLVLDDQAQTVTFTFGHPLHGEYVLDVSYLGVLNDQLAGFYRSSYKSPTGETKFLACTQFEATDCRRAVPCVDEPAAKAIFDVTLFVPSNLTAVSNMPIASKLTTKSSGEEGALVSRGLTYPAGVDRYTFYPSPIMSTYLLAFIVGEFDYISRTSKSGTEVRVYTGRQKSYLGHFALDTAVAALEFYNEYFGIHYPLPKMDLLAIPDFAAGAMENWGAITYRETALLIDPAHSSAAVMQRVARTVCHEIAHMWFVVAKLHELGEVLNEGFARFMEFNAVDFIYPKWKIWESFVAEVFAQAQGLDALETSHPVEVTVHHPNEVNEIFDTISYAKGASLIRMLNSAIGESAFRSGLQAYLKEFQYRNTLSSDLWAAFSKSSGVDVAAMMKTWTQVVGYPVVKVEQKNPQKLCFCQERFLVNYDPSDSKKLTDTLWTIPIQVASYQRADLTAPPHIMKVLFNQHEGEYPALTADDKHVSKLNPGQSGFYRVQYSPELFAQIAPSIPSLPPVERLGLLRDTFALSASGRVSVKQSLDILQYYQQEENYAVVSALAGSLSGLCHIHADTPSYPQLQSLVRATFTSSFHRLGWAPMAGVQEDALIAIFRATVLNMLATNGEDPEVIAEALKRFAAFTQDPAKHPIAADLRATIYTIAAKKGGQSEIDQLRAMYFATDLQEEKGRILQVLGQHSTDESRITDALKFLLSDDVRPGVTAALMGGIGSSKIGRQLAWRWFQENFATIEERFCKGQNFIIAGLLNGMLGGWTSTDILAEVDAFFAAHPIPQATRTLNQLRESITLMAKRREREAPDVAAWFQDRKA